MAPGAAPALLHVLWGALAPPGAGRWYFLLALRLLAVAFARGAWRGPPHDLLCTWAPPGPAPPATPPGLRRLCAALCYNRHFPAPMAALWSLSFLLALLPITLLRLLHPPGRPRRGREGGRDASVAAGGDEDDNVAAGRSNVAAGRSNMAARHINVAAGHSNVAARGDEDANVAIGRGNMAARYTSVAAGYADMAAGRANMATRRVNVAAGRDREGGGEGSGGEDKMAAGRGHKMAAGQRVNGRTKMAAWPCPGDEGSALMWTDELEAAARPRPSHESKMAAGKSKMAAWHHLANESSAASRSGESNMAAGCCPPAQSKMATRHDPPGESNMAAWLHPPAGSNMATRRRPTPGANMATGPALPALPAPSGHDGCWRVWLGAAAAAMLAAGEGAFLWAVLWRQLPAVTAAPIGCRPAAAPCPPLACALPARADKMAALLGMAASAAASLVAVMAAAVMAVTRALRGRGRGGAGPA